MMAVSIPQVTCVKCGRVFEEFATQLDDRKRVWCQKCVREMLSSATIRCSAALPITVSGQGDELVRCQYEICDASVADPKRRHKQHRWRGMLTGKATSIWWGTES